MGNSKNHDFSLLPPIHHSLFTIYWPSGTAALVFDAYDVVPPTCSPLCTSIRISPMSPGSPTCGRHASLLTRRMSASTIIAMSCSIDVLACHPNLAFALAGLPRSTSTSAGRKNFGSTTTQSS